MKRGGRDSKKTKKTNLSAKTCRDSDIPKKN